MSESGERMTYLTVQEAADTLKVCRKTIYTLCNRGDLACVRVGRVIRIPTAALSLVSPTPVPAPRLLGTDHFA